MTHVLVIWQSGFPPEAAYTGTDKAALQAAGDKLCQELDGRETGYDLGHNATVLPVSALPA